MMAFTSSRSSSSSDFEVDSCSKTCVKAYATLKEQYDSLSSDYKKSQFNLVSYKAGLESVEARLAHYKKNEVVFEESINVLKLEVRLRDNALDEYKMKLEKAKKKEMRYNTATAASLAVESFVNSSEMLENQEYNRSKGYHAVPPPLIGNFIPRKPDLTFLDEIVESENMDVTTVVTPSNDKTVENKGVSNIVESNTVRMNNSSAPIIKDWNSDDESKINTTGANVNTAGASINTINRPINIAASTPIMNHPRPISNAFKRGYSQSLRPFNRYYVNKYSINVNTAKVKNTTARDRAVVSENKEKGANAVKASTCWVWKAKNNSASTTFKKYSYIDAQGRSKSIKRV
ncbi:hypothetical protein Tco_1487746 [Tanacetum coccineum]